ncbi:MAG TPA: AI-2E family transporter [Tepidisphaeraceae bacterium]|jgi:predicted PurR-regulated permease PerM|nr:AI-2E family transporter [Tepidisphaeraceae bacterium]
MQQPTTHPAIPPTEPTPNFVWVKPLTSLFIVGALLGVSLYFFSAVSTVILGALAAAIVASTLNPLVRFIPGPRGSGAAILGLSFMAVVGLLIFALYVPLSAPIEKQLKLWPENKVKVDHLLAHWSDAIKLEDPISVDSMVAYTGGFFASESGRGVLSHGADAAFSVLIWLAFIFIGSIFMLADPEDALLGPALRLVAPSRRPRVQAMLDALGPRLRRWVLGTMMSMMIVFSASFLGYWFVGLELALPVAMIAGLAEIVPTVGPAAAAVVAVLFASTQSGGTVVGVLIVYIIIQSIEAYLILPMIMRGAVKIHPAVTLFSVVLWGKLFGVPGMMLAIPINLTIASALEFLYVQPRDQRVMAEIGTLR